MRIPCDAFVVTEPATNQQTQRTSIWDACVELRGEAAAAYVRNRPQNLELAPPGNASVDTVPAEGLRAISRVWSITNASASATRGNPNGIVRLLIQAEVPLAAPTRRVPTRGADQGGIERRPEESSRDFMRRLNEAAVGALPTTQEGMGRLADAARQAGFSVNAVAQALQQSAGQIDAEAANELRETLQLGDDDPNAAEEATAAEEQRTLTRNVVEAVGLSNMHDYSGPLDTCLNDKPQQATVVITDGGMAVRIEVGGQTLDITTKSLLTVLLQTKTPGQAVPKQVRKRRRAIDE